MQPERMRTTVTVYERKQAQRGEEAIENQHPRTPEAEQGGPDLLSPRLGTLSLCVSVNCSVFRALSLKDRVRKSGKEVLQSVTRKAFWGCWVCLLS